MTQAFNLSQFANKLNSSGQTDNTGLQNSSVTVTAGTGMSGGGSVSLGGSTTLTNAGVTSVVAGTGISVSGSTGAVTISSSGGSGTVTSVATGNGLSGGTITSTGTLVIAAPSSNSIGSYIMAYIGLSCNATVTYGSNYAVGTGNNVIQWIDGNNGTINGAGSTTGLSGTWRWMGRTFTAGGCGGSSRALCVRVA
jgi:hypothetical protein